MIRTSFLQNFKRFYPTCPIIYNLHCLRHLVNDVKMYGPLDDFSCFAFESFLSQLKRMVRGTKNPLVQIVNRLSEKFTEFYCADVKFCDQVKCFFKHTTGPLPLNLPFDFVQYKKCSSSSISFSIAHPENCLQFGDSFGLIQNISHCGSSNQTFLLVKKFEKIQEFFTVPCPSSKVGICVMSDLSQTFCLVNVQDVSRKYVIFTSAGSDQYIDVSLRHGLS